MGYKNKLGVGLKVTKDLFSDILQSDCVYDEVVWSVIEHAMTQRKLKRGHKGIITLRVEERAQKPLQAVLEAICDNGYASFLRSR